MTRFAAFFRRLLSVLLLSAAGVLPAHAQTWPSNPIRLILPAGPGSSTEVVARVLSEHLTKRLGVPLVIDYRPGANGAIAGAAVAKAAPDGYTLLVGIPDSQVLGPLVNKPTIYSAEKDFAPVARVSEVSLLVAANPKVPVTNIKELVALAKSQPGKLTFGSSGIGGIQQLTLEMLKQREGLQMLHVPYKSGGQVGTALIAGEVDLLAASPTLLAPLIKSGQARGLGIARESRHALLPGVPTMAEAGYPNFISTSWLAVFAPAGTPKNIVARLSDAILASANTPEFRQRLESVGQDMVPLGHEAFEKFMAAEWARWRQVVDASGFKPAQ